MTKIIFPVGTILFARSYDYARWSQTFKVVELPTFEDSEETFAAIVDIGGLGFIFPADDKNVSNIFTDKPEQAYNFTTIQKEYVTEWYG
jgi:hypothetical protein